MDVNGIYLLVNGYKWDVCIVTSLHNRGEFCWTKLEVWAMHPELEGLLGWDKKSTKKMRKIPENRKVEKIR